jgi:Glycosyltransferase family 87
MDTMQSARWNNRLKAIALGLGLALSTLTVRHWWSIFNYGHPPCNDCVADFPQFYAGAKLVWQNPSRLYDYAEQLALQKTVDPRIEDTTQPFAYPPFTALVLMPLAWLPFSGAFAVMTLANVGLLSVVLLFLIRKLGLGKEQSTWLLLSTFWCP